MFPFLPSLQQASNVLKAIIRNNKRPINMGNKLMPYSNQCNELEKLIAKHEILFSELNLCTWNKFNNTYNIFNDSTCLSNRELSKKNHRLESLNVRVSFLVDETINKKLNSFVIMDGYGTTLNNIISELLLRNQNPYWYNFFVVDIDSNVNKWHQLFFPDNIISVEGDIFEFAQGEGHRYCANSILYLNFCGLGGDENGMKLLRFMQNYNYPLLLSYSTNRRAHGMYSYLDDYFKQRNVYEVEKERSKIFRSVFIE